MRKINFDPQTLKDERAKWWTVWSEKAADATGKLLKSNDGNESYAYKNSIWSELKKWLLKNVFNGKCAYCESRFSATSFGHADHYRPKNRVTIKENNKSKKIDVGGKEHPGYYWLVYSWKNILPACDSCNSGEGKMCHFPIENQYIVSEKHAKSVEEMNKIEEPLLLNPYFDEPSEHLAFGLNGMVSCRDDSLKGKISIDVYNLRRITLCDERKERQEFAYDKFFSILPDVLDQKKSIDEIMEKFTGGAAPYSSAVKDYMNLRKEDAIAFLEQELKK